ncbi:hypothetical protein KI387_003292, partial [Taxus chinensis]
GEDWINWFILFEQQYVVGRRGGNKGFGSRFLLCFNTSLHTDRLEISNHPEAYVRRSSLFSASRILIALHPSFIAKSLSGGDAEIAKGLEWIHTWDLRVA